jgi:DNA-binding NarL/FixJ family response regulator
MHKKINVLIADGQKMFVQGVARLFEDVACFAPALEADDCGAAIAAVKSRRIDVAVLGHSLPERGGISLIRDLKALQPLLRTLVVSATVDDPYVLPALHAGSDGYITKEDSAEELIAAVRRLAEGGRYVCRAVAEQQTFDFAGGDPDQPDHMRLSRREFEVFRLLIAGRRGSEIAERLSLSEKTVSSHKTSVLRKLRVSGVAELVRYAIRHDLGPA